MAKLSATEAARNFSDVLNRAAAGEEIEIVRNGATVALLGPSRHRLLSPEAFRELLGSAPPIDDQFGADLRRVRVEAGTPESRMAVLIDTDLLVEWERSGAGDLQALLGDEERAISVITVSELLHGVHRATGGRRVRRQAFVEHIIAGFDPIPITEAVARIHAEVWARLSRRGETIGAHDLWIGATALAHGLGVATRNSGDFGRIPGLRVLTRSDVKVWRLCTC